MLYNKRSHDWDLFMIHTFIHSFTQVISIVFLDIYSDTNLQGLTNTWRNI